MPTVGRFCPECGSNQLTWQVSSRRGMMPESASAFAFLGCDECSGTVTTLDEGGIEAILNAAQAERQDSTKVQAQPEQGYELVVRGEVPSWMERVDGLGLYADGSCFLWGDRPELQRQVMERRGDIPVYRLREGSSPTRQVGAEYDRDEWAAWHADVALGKDLAWSPTKVMLHLELAEREIVRLERETVLLRAALHTEKAINEHRKQEVVRLNAEKASDEHSQTPTPETPATTDMSGVPDIFWAVETLKLRAAGERPVLVERFASEVLTRRFPEQFTAIKREILAAVQGDVDAGADDA